VHGILWRVRSTVIHWSLKIIDCLISGSLCETRTNFCEPENPCLNGAECSSDLMGVICSCPAGITGSLCETNIDECDSSPCLNDGVCEDGINGFQCECPVGISGKETNSRLVWQLAYLWKEWCYWLNVHFQVPYVSQMLMNVISSNHAKTMPHVQTDKMILHVIVFQAGQVNL